MHVIGSGSEDMGCFGKYQRLHQGFQVYHKKVKYRLVVCYSYKYNFNKNDMFFVWETGNEEKKNEQCVLNG